MSAIFCPAAVLVSTATILPCQHNSCLAIATMRASSLGLSPKDWQTSSVRLEVSSSLASVPTLKHLQHLDCDGTGHVRYNTWEHPGIWGAGQLHLTVDQHPAQMLRPPLRLLTTMRIAQFHARVVDAGSHPHVAERKRQAPEAKYKWVIDRTLNQPLMPLILNHFPSCMKLIWKPRIDNILTSWSSMTNKDRWRTTPTQPCASGGLAAISTWDNIVHNHNIWYMI